MILKGKCLSDFNNWYLKQPSAQAGKLRAGVEVILSQFWSKDNPYKFQIIQNYLTYSKAILIFVFENQLSASPLWLSMVDGVQDYHSSENEAKDFAISRASRKYNRTTIKEDFLIN